MLPEWHDATWQSAALEAGLQLPKLMPFPLINITLFLFSLVITFPGYGNQSYVDFLFASSKVHMHMGGEIVQNAKDYIFPSVVVVLWLRSQRAKEMQMFSKVATGAGTEPLCITRAQC